jgi:hypothetical protein
METNDQYFMLVFLGSFAVLMFLVDMLHNAINRQFKKRRHFDAGRTKDRGKENL